MLEPQRQHHLADLRAQSRAAATPSRRWISSLATCCVIVEPPSTTWPSTRFCRAARSERHGIDAGMRVEPPILRRERRRLEHRRQRAPHRAAGSATRPATAPRTARGRADRRRPSTACRRRRAAPPGKRPRSGATRRAASERRRDAIADVAERSLQHRSASLHLTVAPSSRFALCGTLGRPSRTVDRFTISDSRSPPSPCGRTLPAAYISSACAGAVRNVPAVVARTT